MRAPAAVAGLLGGLCWLAAAVVDAAGGGGLVDALTWAGIALLAIAALAAGAAVVSRSVVWLRVLVSICFLALAASVVQVIRDAGDPVVIDAVVGVGAAVVAGVVLARRRTPEPASHPRRRRGSHAR